jgi:GNAT superfamily N-acetyltransferase
VSHDNTLPIRIAVPADVRSLFDIRTSVRENHMSFEELAKFGITPDPISNMLNGDARTWVAEENGKAIAFAMANAMEATVFAMFVRLECEGRGLGRRLMKEAEQWLFSQRCEEIWFVTDSDRTVRADGFYRHLGWKDRGVQDNGERRFTKRSSRDEYPQHIDWTRKSC